jgi:hypothetical protein
MRTILPTDRGVDQLQISVVHQDRGLQGMAGAFSTHLTRRNLMQRVFDQWQEISQCALIAAAPVEQESGYVIVITHRPGLRLQA